MSISGRLCLAAVAMAAPGVAPAATCLAYAPTTFPDTGICVSASAVVISNSVAVVGSPSNGVNSTASLAAGVGVEAKSVAFADAGVVKLTAQASDGGGDASSSASARAAAGFSDIGAITSTSGKAGDPVSGIVKLAITGSHTDHAGLGPAFPHLNVAWTTAAGIFGGSFYNLENPANGAYAFNSFVGNNIFVSLGLEIFADAVPGRPLEFADYGHTARLFIDFTTPGAFLDAASGHDYRSGALPDPDPNPGPGAVPVPASFPLLLAGLGVLAGRGWKRRAERRGV